MTKFISYRENGNARWVDCRNITDRGVLDLAYVARRLSTTFRFNGQYSEEYKKPYNVAHHSYILADILIAEELFKDTYDALMHELDEVFIGDIISPIKEYIHLERNKNFDSMSENIYSYYGVNRVNDVVKRFDKFLGTLEAEILFPSCKLTPKTKEYKEFKNKHYNQVKKLIHEGMRLSMDDYMDFTYTTFKHYYKWYGE